VAALKSLRSPDPLAALIHRLESLPAVAAAATLLLAATVAIAFWQGLPRLALRGAYAVPTSVETDAGHAGYAYFSRSFKPTAINYGDRVRVYKALERLKKARTLHVEPTVYFFQMRSANAFALPGGFIVVGDELAHLAQSEEEIAAVLAHEIGHVEKRHGLQSVLRNSSALIIVSTLTGDLSTLSTFSGTLPFLLLEYGYSREFEREADAYAVDLLRDAHIDPVNLAIMLRRLELSRPASGPDFSYLSTHPATEERVKFIDSFGTKVTAAMLRPKPNPELDGIFKTTSSTATLGEVSQVPAANVRALAVVTTTSTSIPGNPDDANEGTPDSPPYPLARPAAKYPDALRRAGITGSVTVDFVVDTHGDVVNARVVDASFPDFEAAALEAVRRWKFQPAVRNHQAVATHMRVPVGFTLTPAEQR
jgi:TonB family protein